MSGRRSVYSYYYFVTVSLIKDLETYRSKIINQDRVFLPIAYDMSLGSRLKFLDCFYVTLFCAPDSKEYLAKKC